MKGANIFYSCYLIAMISGQGISLSTCEANDGELCNCFGNMDKCYRPEVLDENAVGSCLPELLAYLNRPQLAHRVCIPIELVERIIKELQENDS